MANPKNPNPGNKPYSQGYAQCYLLIQNIKTVVRGDVSEHWTWFFLEQVGQKWGESIPIVHTKKQIILLLNLLSRCKQITLSL